MTNTSRNIVSDSAEQISIIILTVIIITIIIITVSITSIIM